jgi:hypothetical protein
MNTIDDDLERLERNGFLLIEGALTPKETETARVHLNRAREMGWQEGLNAVGNMWFDHLLEQDEETFRPFIAHPSVRPYLDALLGPQCQVRSLRAHINPGAYKQEWHMDFYGYWSQPQARYTVRGTGVNTTFYFQDNGPGIAHLTYIKGGHRLAPPSEALRPNGWPVSEEAFNAWGDAQEQVTIYPKAGDCVLFFSHIPHRGAKEDPTVERSNVVVHYQGTPFYEGIAHVSRPIGYAGTFPLVPKR